MGQVPAGDQEGAGGEIDVQNFLHREVGGEDLAGEHEVDEGPVSVGRGGFGGLDFLAVVRLPADEVGQTVGDDLTGPVAIDPVDEGNGDDGPRVDEGVDGNNLVGQLQLDDGVEGLGRGLDPHIVAELIHGIVLQNNGIEGYLDDGLDGEGDVRMARRQEPAILVGGQTQEMGVLHGQLGDVVSHLSVLGEEFAQGKSLVQ